MSPEPETKRSSHDAKSKDEAAESPKLDGQVHLEKFYYATMEGDRYYLARETKSSCAFEVNSIGIQVKMICLQKLLFVNISLLLIHKY